MLDHAVFFRYQQLPLHFPFPFPLYPQSRPFVDFSLYQRMRLLLPLVNHARFRVRLHPRAALHHVSALLLDGHSQLKFALQQVSSSMTLRRA